MDLRAYRKVTDYFQRKYAIDMDKLDARQQALIIARETKRQQKKAARVKLAAERNAFLTERWS